MSESESRRALPPVDGLEVVAELNRIIAEEAADFAEAEGHAIEAGERPDIWDREVEVSVHTLSQASSVIAGLKAEIDDLRDEWQAEYDARLAANTTRRAAEARTSSVIAGLRAERITAERDALDAYRKLQAAEARTSSLEEENKRLREALEAAKVWHEAEDKALSKQPPSSGPNGNAWARLQHQEQMREIETALLPTTEDHNG